MILAKETACEPKSRPLSSVTPVVFVVDDDVSTRESLSSLIHSAGRRPEAFALSQDLLARPRALVPSCLVLDVTKLGVGALEVQCRIAAERADMPIIIITGHADVPTSVRAMKAGAVEVLTKPIDGDALLRAIDGALERSQIALDRGYEELDLRERYACLSNREREVMALVMSGLLNKQVGGELNISEITVKAHRGRVMRKMRARSLAHLVNMGLRLRDVLDREVGCAFEGAEANLPLGNEPRTKRCSVHAD